MELRKDPLTRSWVLTGDDIPETVRPAAQCRFCPGAPDEVHQISSRSGLQGAPWSARAVVHPVAIYHVEGSPDRRGAGLYDHMPTIGAHEVLLENPKHDRDLWNADDAEIEQFLLLSAQRVQDLKGDVRLRYISIYKNYGPGSGQEFEHPHSELTATTFIPRRALYELRACLDYFKQKERCVFCDMVAQEMNQGERIVEVRGDFLTFCPYATRAPYECWIMSSTHDSAYEDFTLSQAGRVRDLAALLRRTLRRIRTITESFHLVVHTSPNKLHASASLGYWKTLDDDYHWHIEILPILPSKSKSYTFKEVYYSPVSAESAAQRLREAAP